MTTGEFTFTPTDPTFSGEPTFSYTIEDPSGATDTATATITVTADPDPDANDAPEAGDDLITATVGEMATGDLLANDTDPNNDDLTITDVNGVDPATGPITLTDPTTGETQGVLTSIRPPAKSPSHQSLASLARSKCLTRSTTAKAARTTQR